MLNSFIVQHITHNLRILKDFLTKTQLLLHDYTVYIIEFNWTMDYEIKENTRQHPKTKTKKPSWTSDLSRFSLHLGHLCHTSLSPWRNVSIWYKERTWGFWGLLLWGWCWLIDGTRRELGNITNGPGWWWGKHGLVDQVLCFCWCHDWGIAE